jgi:hypothetical protein
MKVKGRRMQILLINLCAILLVCGCTVTQVNTKNDWIRSPKNEASFKSKIPVSDFVELDVSMLSKATSVLADKVFMRIDPADVKNFFPAWPASTHSDKNKYYLVRVVKYDATGKFSVYRNGHEIYVSHVSLGPQNRKVLKSIILVAVEFDVEDAFSDYSSAE